MFEIGHDYYCSGSSQRASLSEVVLAMGSLRTLQ